MPGTLTAVPLEAIEAARTRLEGVALRTPLVRLGLPDDSPRIFLKLENLQPIGSFKLRGAANAIADMQEWAAMNRIYVEHFTGDLPARSAFGASSLALGGRIEIECIATID